MPNVPALPGTDLTQYRLHDADADVDKFSLLYLQFDFPNEHVPARRVDLPLLPAPGAGSRPTPQIIDGGMPALGLISRSNLVR